MSEKFILTNDQINQKIKRMAYEIFEDNYNAKQITIVGIEGQGLAVAKALHKELEKIFPINYTLIPAEIDKKNPSSYKPELEKYKKNIEKNALIIVDDVLNSGRTIMHTIQPFLSFKPSSIQVAVLINRDHKSFPVQVDFTGLSLATTIQDHVSVNLNKKGAYSASLK
ncbi:MAG: phosphoribosyltransferase family protein [Cytophagales bacterium]